MPELDEFKWRVGTKIPINVYIGEDIPVCQCQTAYYARLIVAAVNEYLERKRNGV
jgi:hypothetical protein